MTIKELAEKCCVSEQSIRAWCKRNNVLKAPQGNDNKLQYQITPDIEDEILCYYGKGNVAKATKDDCETQESKKSVISGEKQVTKEACESQESTETQVAKDDNPLINELIRQLSEKDKLIQALSEQNKALIESLDKAQENNKSLTDALVAAQTLHAATIQTTALVDKSAEPERKWWQKIFKKTQKEN